MSKKLRPADIGYVAGVDDRMVVWFRSRFNPPMDDTTSFGIEHRTIGGYVGVLFEREEFHLFAEWLFADAPDEVDTLSGPFVRPVDDRGAPRYVRQTDMTGSQFRIIDLQTGALFSKRKDGQIMVSCWRLGSGRRKTAVLDVSAAVTLRYWALDKDSNGWTGWRSGRADATEA